MSTMYEVVYVEPLMKVASAVKSRAVWERTLRIVILRMAFLVIAIRVSVVASLQYTRISHRLSCSCV